MINLPHISLLKLVRYEINRFKTQVSPKEFPERLAGMSAAPSGYRTKDLHKKRMRRSVLEDASYSLGLPYLVLCTSVS